MVLEELFEDNKKNTCKFDLLLQNMIVMECLFFTEQYNFMSPLRVKTSYEYSLGLVKSPLLENISHTHTTKM